MDWKRLWEEPEREYLLSGILLWVLIAGFLFQESTDVLLVVSLIGAVPTLWSATRSLGKRRITIDTFNAFAIVISVATGEVRSTAFIALMLSFARILDRYTESRTQRAVEELLKLKPSTARRETKAGGLEDVAVEDLRVGDRIVAPTGSRIAVDGIVVKGEGYLNEASVTGESVPVKKSVGDSVIAGTLVDAGAFTMSATQVGVDTTIERMAALMREAATQKSRSEKLADRFAAIFLPIVALVGLGTYLLTKNAGMMAAIFLVACADDMAVAIPLAMMAAIGQAAKRGVIVKGGEWLDVMGRVRAIVFDKTGTLTYGSLQMRDAWIAPEMDPAAFWRMLGAAEKYSEHPVGRTIFRAAGQRGGEIPEPKDFRPYRGSGVGATVDGKRIVAGNEQVFSLEHCVLSAEDLERLAAVRRRHGQTAFGVCMDGILVGIVAVADEARPEARASMERLRRLGISRLVMFTGDHVDVAKRIGASLGIDDVRSSMKPEDKVKSLDAVQGRPLAMVGDGINDAPALARADVGIAMGGGGSAVAVEAANIVILTDDLSRLPELVDLGRRTRSVIQGDMAIWFVTNVFGFLLVFTGFLGPALAAFYNFATDFLPLLNSMRLFRKRKAT